MKTTMMKKIAACLLALLLVIQVVPVVAGQEESAPYTLTYTIFRDQLEVSAPTSILKVGMTAQLTWTSGYNNLTWSSEKESVATVDENGLVTAVGEGTAKIRATEGEYSDSVTIKVVGAPSAPETGSKTEDDSGTMVIIISVAKEKVEYDGEVHTSHFTAVSDAAGFNEANVKLKDETNVVSAKGCGVYKTKYTPADFYYEGNDDVEFVVGDGWIQIKPRTATIKANDAEKYDGDPDPEFTATVTGLLEGDDPAQIKYSFETLTENGVTKIYPVPDETIQGNYRVSAQPGTLTVIQMNEFPLYNIAKINGTWYRLGKTTIRTPYTSVAAARKATKDGKGVMVASDYKLEEYNFDDLTITINGKEYLYSCDKNAKAILDGANYYTVKHNNVEAVLNKIGAMNGSSPRWLVPADQQYPDKNETDSFHHNYDITLVENNTSNITAEDQPIYNMLCVNGNTNYYRLKRTTIYAEPLSNFTYNTTLKAGTYVYDKYDFTNVVLVIDGVEYKYSDHELTGEHEPYFTVKFDRVVTSERINGDADWYKQDEGWQDGSYEQFGTLPNNTYAFHANYNATTYAGTIKREKSIELSSDYNKEIGYVGLKITLTANLTGYDGLVLGKDYRLKWQYCPVKGGDNWIDIEGAEGIQYSFILDQKTTNYSWRVIAEDIE